MLGFPFNKCILKYHLSQWCPVSLRGHFWRLKNASEHINLHIERCKCNYESNYKTSGWLSKGKNII